MRFIGSKLTLLDNIKKVIDENTSGNENIFCDLFSGTASVARYFKPKYEIYSNDTLYFSYVLQKATIENNTIPDFKNLKLFGINDPFLFLEETQINILDYNDEHYFITKHYTPHDNCNRMYVSNKNAARIDFIRLTIEAWKKENLITELEYYYLLAGLIEGVSRISNTTGTYGAYLKKWDNRAYKNLELTRFNIINNKNLNKCYNMDALKLISELEGDILYLDPPYNTRQYAPNYHFLETIAKYDYPKIYGITGMRPYQELKSPFCIKNEVEEAFEEIIAKAKFSNIIMSYNTQGLMKKESIEKVLKKNGQENTFKLYLIPYRQYLSKKTQEKETLYEYLFFIKKRINNKYIFDCLFDSNENKEKITKNNATVDEKKYIKSPMNYIGGKYKLLPQILPYFPKNINRFIDLFAGACNVAINVDANSLICNDINSKVIELFKTLKKEKLEDILEQIEGRIEEYNLSKNNEEGFLNFRDFYNKTRNPIDLYTLTCFSFNYQFRFNNNLEYNNPFGRNRSRFSEKMKSNLILFVNKLKNIDIEFTNFDFRNFNIDQLNKDDFVYCDPPYFITTGMYNDGNRGFKDWKYKEEYNLYEYLDKINLHNIKFALSNVIEHKGKTNKILLEWSQKYKIINLTYDYSNSSYNTKKGESREVLVINY